ncbi:hypothetical protein JCM10207_000206 [Rhodosporidiobolus poonsookiae]
MTSALWSLQTPTAGALLGSAGEPPRYILLKQLHGPHHVWRTEDKAPEVWSARSLRTDEIVAVKLLPAESQVADTHLMMEALPLWRVAGYTDLQPPDTPTKLSSHPGQKHCIRILDAFALPESDGKRPTEPDEADQPYACDDAVLALELVGPSLAVWQNARPSPFFSLDLARRLVKQVLLAIDYLHEKVPVETITHCAAKQLEQDAPVPDPQIKLVGFGCAHGNYHEDPEPERWIQPGSWDSASPEQLLLFSGYGIMSPVKAIDIWAVGVITSRLLFNRNLAVQDFDLTLRLAHFTDELDWWSVSSHVVLSLASLQPEKGWPEYLDRAGHRPRTPNYPFNVPGVTPLPTLRERVEAHGKIDDPAELDKLVTFLGACWTLDPYTRPSAKKLLQHEWLQGVEESGRREG